MMRTHGYINKYPPPFYNANVLTTHTVDPHEWRSIRLPRTSNHSSNLRLHGKRKQPPALNSILKNPPPCFCLASSRSGPSETLLLTTA